MQARFLKKGEEKKWFDLQGEESEERFTETTEYRIESHIVVEEGNRVVGGMYLFIDEPDFLMLFNPKLIVDAALDLLLRKALETAQSLNINEVFSLIHESNDRFQEIDKTLSASKFVFGMKKILYQLKSIAPSDAESGSSLKYEPFCKDSEACFIEIYRQVYQPDIFGSDADKSFIDLKKSAINTKRFYPEDWVIAYQGSKNIGITMPQLHDEGGEIGSNYFLGVVPEERNRGFGRVLQRRAVETLFKRGAKMIVGSTDIKNTAMTKVFESLGYEFSEYQYFYKYAGIL